MENSFAEELVRRLNGLLVNRLDAAALVPIVRDHSDLLEKLAGRPIEATQQGLHVTAFTLPPEPQNPTPVPDASQVRHATKFLDSVLWDLKVANERLEQYQADVESTRGCSPPIHALAQKLCAEAEKETLRLKAYVDAAKLIEAGDFYGESAHFEPTLLLGSDLWVKEPLKIRIVTNGYAVHVAPQ